MQWGEGEGAEDKVRARKRKETLWEERREGKRLGSVRTREEKTGMGGGLKRGERKGAGRGEG